VFLRRHRPSRRRCIRGPPACHRHLRLGLHDARGHPWALPTTLGITVSAVTWSAISRADRLDFHSAPMQALGNGESFDRLVPYQARTEIGQMADTLQVFSRLIAKVPDERRRWTGSQDRAAGAGSTITRKFESMIGDIAKPYRRPTRARGVSRHADRQPAERSHPYHLVAAASESLHQRALGAVRDRGMASVGSRRAAQDEDLVNIRTER